MNMTDEELMKSIGPILHHPSYKFFIELIKRKQATQIKTICRLSDPVEIYRSQGQVKAFDTVLVLTE